MKKFITAALVGGLAVVGLSACSDSDADVAAHNISKEAEQFKVERRIVFFNGITDKYLLTIEGRCSIETADSAAAGSLEVTCKIGPDEYKKSFLGLSDNVSYFVEQLQPIDVSVYRYEVIYKPTTIIPDIKVPIGEQG